MDFTMKIAHLDSQILRSKTADSIVALLCVLLFGIGYSCLVWANTGTPAPTTSFPNITIKAKVIGQTTISVKEPVLVRIIVTNAGSKSIYLPISNNAGGSLHFAISDPNGQLVGAPPPKTFQGGLVAVTKIAPNGQWTGLKSLNDWYTFDRPGKYQVRVQRLGGNPVRPIAEDKFQINVVTYNPIRIEARCLELFAHIEPSFRNLTPQIAGLDQNTAMQTLFSIRDEVALPYFDYLAKEYSSIEACLAIRRVKTKRAEQLIKALAARQDDIGKAARQALKLSLEEPKPQTNVQD